MRRSKPALAVLKRLIDGRLIALADAPLPATVPGPIEAEPEFTYLSPQEAQPAQVDV